MVKVLLTDDEFEGKSLLIYQALLALTNIATCVQGAAKELYFADEILSLSCSSSTLYQKVTQEYIFSENK